MAMLAEPRRRQRWTLNPRGKHWSEDTNKFGQKMLEKMGWSSGKGLGANEQGMTEHVRVALKNDNAGFGFKNDGMDKAWTEHHDGFNDLLKELQGSQDTSETVIVETKHETLSGTSLEQKSKQSRARVHYHKFTRGKDVNKYSSKDLANIFGQKDLSIGNLVKEKVEEKKEEEEEEYSADPVGTEDTRGGVLTIKSGSMSDYFRNKGLYKAPETSKVERQTDSEDEPAYAGFGFSSSQNQEKSNDESSVGMCNYGFVNPCLKLDSSEETASPVKKVKKSKKRKSGSTFYDEELNDSKKANEDPASSNDCTNGFVNPALSLGNEAEETQNGLEFEVSRAEFGLTNCAFDPEDEKGSKKRVTFNDHVEYSTDPIKKKKGKATLDKFEVEIKKHKRKRKHEETDNDCAPTGFVNEALDCEDKSNEILDNEINERKTRKVKKRRASLLATIVETPEEEKPEIIELDNGGLKDEDDIVILENESTEKDGKKKKKKKKKDKVKDQDPPKETDVSTKDEEHVDHTPKNKKKNAVTIEAEQQASEKSAGESKKKKKQKHTENLEPTVNDQTNELESTSEHSSKKGESSTKKKKDKKSKRDVDKYEVITIDDNSKNEKEISDKENTGTDQEDKAKSKKKKSKKDKTKSTDKSSDLNSTNNVGETKENPELDVQESVNAYYASNDAKTLRSPWNERARMSKKLLQSFFHRNAISNFPGSNIYDIEGYGANIV